LRLINWIRRRKHKPPMLIADHRGATTERRGAPIG